MAWSIYTHVQIYHRVEELTGRIDDGGLSVVSSKQSPSNECGVIGAGSVETSGSRYSVQNYICEYGRK